VGILEDIHLRQIAAIKRNCENTISTNYSHADDWCSSILKYVQKVSDSVVNYDATIFKYDLDALQIPYIDYLSADSNPKSADLYQALHISQSTKKPIFESSSQRVYNAIEPEEYIDWTHFYDSMLTLNGGLDVLVYAGHYDQQDGPLTMPVWMRDM
jgi:hypothetical protein